MEQYQQALERRRERALNILEAGMVSPNGMDGQYIVRSQSGNGAYLTRVRRITGGRIVCGCRDTWAKRHGIPCKHVLAAEMYEAEQAAQRLAEGRGWTINRLANQLLVLLCGGAPQPVSDYALDLFHACNRILNRNN